MKEIKTDIRNDLFFEDGEIDPRTGTTYKKSVQVFTMQDLKNDTDKLDAICHVKEIENFTELLTNKALNLYQKRCSNVIHEADKWCSKEKKLKRNLKLCAYLTKPVYVQNGKKPPEKAIKWLANAFNKLVEEDMIDFGILLPASWMPLKLEPDTIIIMLYCFPSFKTEDITRKRITMDTLYDIHLEEINVLNEFLGTKAFAPEGEIGDDKFPNYVENSD